MCWIASQGAVYPKTIIIGNDTLVAFTRAQRIEILKAYEKIDYLQAQVNTYAYTDSVNAAQIDALQCAVEDYRRIIDMYKAASAQNEIATAALMNEIKLLNKKQRAVKAKWIVTAVGGTAGGAGLGFLIGFFYAKH